MDTSRIPLVCALGALAAWAVKAVVRAVSDGADGALPSALFLLGMALAMAAAVGIALVLTRGRPRWQRALAGLVGLLAGPAVALPLNLAIEALATSEHWVWSEVNLWVVAVLLVAVALGVGRRGRAGAEREAVAALV